MLISAKVADILNERDLVINKGSNAGVEEGMRFAIFEVEIPVMDPDTSEFLGSLNREKIRIRIVDVQPKLAIGKTYQTYTVNLGGSGIAYNLLHQFEPRKEVTRVRTLRSDTATQFQRLDKENSFVKVGDPVVEIEDESDT